MPILSSASDGHWTYIPYNSKMANLSLLLLGIALCIAPLLADPCEAQTEVPGLFQDSINLNIDKAYSRHSYEYPGVLFPSEAPRIAISFSKLEIKNLKNLDYQIATIVGQSNNLIFYLIFPNVQAKWKSLRLTFWLLAKQLQGISVGYVAMDTIAPSSTKKLVYTQAEQVLLAKVNQGQLSDPKVFVSSVLGMSATFATNYLEYKLASLVLKKVSQAKPTPTYSIQFSIQTGYKSAIKAIRFCYILYAPSRLSTTKSHYLPVSQALSQSGLVTNFVLEPLTIFPVKYWLLGITGIRTSNMDTLSLNISLESGQLDLLRYESKAKLDLVHVNLLVIGHDMMMACINCPESFVQPSPAGTFCVTRRSCAPDEVESVDKDGIYYSCRKCVGEAAIMGPSTSKYCGCRTGYNKERDGTCKKVEVFKSVQDCSDPNSVRDVLTGACICKEGFQRDEFGLCGGCDQATSYFDLNTEKCVCFPGYVMNPFKGQCVEKGKSCGQNQMYLKDRCQCQEFTIRKPKGESFECVECPSGTFKKEDLNQCEACPSACGECISGLFCLTCQPGYFFNDFQCEGRCGDGIKTNNEMCDDGNYFDQDGCSSTCKVEDGFACVEDQNKRSVCRKKGQQLPKRQPTQDKQIQPIPAGPISTPSLENQSNKTVNTSIPDSNGMKTPESNTTTASEPTKIVQILKPIQAPQPAQPAQDNTTVPQGSKASVEYRLSVSKSSPIYLSSGIVLELLVKPDKKRTQEQLNKMFKIEVSDKRALPPSIYISQDPARYSSVRCYLHYNNQLPVVDFSIKLWAMLAPQVWRTLTLYAKIFGKLSRSIQPVDDDSFLL